MRKGRLLFALGTLASSLAAVVSCGDDTSGVAPDGGSPEAGVDGAMVADATTSGDGALDDGSSDGGAGVRAFALNGIVTVESPIRFCFLASKSGPPTLADGVDAPPSAALAAGTINGTSLPGALVGSYVKIVVYYEDSLTAFGVADKTCRQLLAMSALDTTEPADAGADADVDASNDAGSDADASDDAGDELDASDDAADGDASNAGDDDDDDNAAVPMGGATGLQLLQYADFDISDEVIPPSTIKADASYLLYASGCTHRQSPSHSYTICNHDEAYHEAFGPDPYTDFYAWLIELDTTSPAPSSDQSRVQGVLGTDVWRSSGLFDNQAIGVMYGDASVELKGPGAPSDPDAGTFPYIVASQPAHPGTLVPSLTNATAFYWILPYYEAQVSLSKDALELSGLTADDLATASTLTLVPIGNAADEPERLPDGKLNPRYLGFRVIRNK